MPSSVAEVPIRQTVAHLSFVDLTFAGGCVRDLELGLRPGDYDIATSARPDDVCELFPRTVPIGAKFGVILVVTPQ